MLFAVLGGASLTHPRLYSFDFSDSSEIGELR